MLIVEDIDDVGTCEGCTLEWGEPGSPGALNKSSDISIGCLFLGAVHFFGVVVS